MSATLRPYHHAADFAAVGAFLSRTYSEAGPHINWLQPRWEYMHFHPLIRNVDLASIGVWEDGGQIVALVHPEHEMGHAYFERDVPHDDLCEPMLDHAEQHISKRDAQGKRRLRIFVLEGDEAMESLARTRGYAPLDWRDPMSVFPIPSPFPPIDLPEGFRLLSLADENDLWKVEQVLWRGFGHEGDPPDAWLEDKRLMQSAPNYRRDLNVVVANADGQFVAYCGMWLEPAHEIAYVEPVATDPDYRRMGLGRAAVLEGIRRCGELGMAAAYVGTDMPFYLSFGFEPRYCSHVWERTW